MTMENSDKIADAVLRHADAVMQAAGTALRHYEKRSQQRVIQAVLECYEEAYRDGAAFAQAHFAARNNGGQV